MMFLLGVAGTVLCLGSGKKLKQYTFVEKNTEILFEETE